MGDLLRLGSISLAQLTEARLWIQSISTRVAVERATEEDIARLDPNVQEAERLFLAGEFERKAHVNIAFHILLAQATHNRSEEHTSELTSLMRISDAVFCLHTKTKH